MTGSTDTSSTTPLFSPKQQLLRLLFLGKQQIPSRQPIFTPVKVPNGFHCSLQIPRQKYQDTRELIFLTTQPYQRVKDAEKQVAAKAVAYYQAKEREANGGYTQNGNRNSRKRNWREQGEMIPTYEGESEGNGCVKNEDNDNEFDYEQEDEAISEGGEGPVEDDYLRYGQWLQDTYIPTSSGSNNKHCTNATPAERLDTLENLTHYRFRNPELALQALRHGSVPNAPNQQALAYYGNLLRSEIHARWILEMNPCIPHSEFTKLHLDAISSENLELASCNSSVTGLLESGNLGPLGVSGKIRGACVCAVLAALQLDGGSGVAERWWKQVTTL